MKPEDEYNILMAKRGAKEMAENYLLSWQGGFADRALEAINALERENAELKEKLDLCGCERNISGGMGGK